MFEFGEYLPDLPSISNPGLTDASSVVPDIVGYTPFPSLNIITTTAIDAFPQGGFAARDPSAVGTTHVYVGDATKLYELDGDAWTDLSGATYSTQAEDVWSFAQWGTQIVATNFSDNIQVATIGGGAFSDLGGSPPQARFVDVVGEFLVVANTYDASDGYQPQRVRWSGIGDLTSWTVSSTTQAGFNDLYNNGGFIQGIVGGDYGLIFQERTITRMTYVGSPVVFQFDLIEHERGAYAPGSIVKIGNQVAYLAEDGFFIFDGNQSIPIGRGKVDETFFAELNKDYLNRIKGVLYPGKQVIAWSYVTVNSADGFPDKILLYNYSPSSKTRWSYVLVDHTLLMSPISQGYTLDGLDAVSTNVDILPFSLDSPVWAGQQKLLGAMDTDYNLGFFNGSAMDALLETGEYELNTNKRTSISMLRPHVIGNSATVTVQVGGRDILTTAGVFQSTVSLNSAGFAPVRINERFIAARVYITGEFEHAVGLEMVQSASTGRR